MTALSQRVTKLRFETDSMIRTRAIVVEPEPLVCWIRPKGTRQRFAISWITIYEHAAEIAARRAREERKQARKLRRRK